MQAEVEEFLGPMVSDAESSIETASIAALALGMVFVGTASDGSVEAILQALMMRSQARPSSSPKSLYALSRQLHWLGHWCWGIGAVCNITPGATSLRHHGAALTALHLTTCNLTILH